MKIDINPIQTELNELAGNRKVKIKLDKRMDISTSVSETDQGFYIRLNPTRINTPKQLENHLNMCREAVGGEY